MAFCRSEEDIDLFFEMSSALFAALLLLVISSSYEYDLCEPPDSRSGSCCCSVTVHTLLGTISTNMSCGENGGLDAYLYPVAVNCKILSDSNNPDVNVPAGSGKQYDYPSAWRDRKLYNEYVHIPEMKSSYKFHTFPETWQNARRECENEGAHLAIINSERESHKIQDIFKNHRDLPYAHQKDFAFVGYHDIYEEGTYLTIFGEPLSKTGFTRLWGSNDNAEGSNVYAGEDCGSIHRHGGGLNDANCGYQYPFFCEREDEEYPPRHGIDYSAGAYEGVEMERKSPIGTVLRTRASPGYEHFPGVGFYRFHTTPNTWENARRICKAEGGHLAIINSNTEHQVLLDLFRRYPEIHYVYHRDYAYIGFHDQFQEGHYVTIFGEALTTVGFYQWKSGEPNDSGGGRGYSGEDCGTLYRPGGLNDVDCNNIYAFICEQDLYE